MRAARAVLAALVGAVAVAGCATVAGAGGATATPGSAGSLRATGAPAADEPVTGDVVVLAAASLTGPVTELAARFEAAHPGVRVVLSFGASSALATQITAGGVPADVFVSASTATMDAVVSAGDAAGPAVVARNELTIAVPVGNPARITGLGDLARPGTRVALCQLEVPCGDLAARVLANAGLAVQPVTREADVKATLSKVVLGEVDAGLVYVTDVRAAADHVTAVTIPADVNESAEYPVAVLTGAPNLVGAQAFVALMRSAEGAEVLADAGFARP